MWWLSLYDNDIYIICLLQKVAHFKALLAKKKVSLPNVKLVSISFRACKYFMYAIFWVFEDAHLLLVMSITSLEEDVDAEYMHYMYYCIFILLAIVNYVVYFAFQTYLTNVADSCWCVFQPQHNNANSLCQLSYGLCCVFRPVSQ